MTFVRFGVTACALVLAACALESMSSVAPSSPASAPPSPVAAPPSPIAAAPSHDARSWGYDGERGPSHWSEIDPGYSLCSTGTRQTPIDLSSHAAASSTPAITGAHFLPIALNVANKGHTVQNKDDSAASGITVAGTPYTLLQFHFHSPAEHTIDGKTFDVEMHIVHKSADAKLLVVGVLFNRGRENATLKPVWDAMPMDASEPPREAANVRIDVATFVPQSARLFAYEGSLTTPPCSEGVQWLVVEPDPNAPNELSDAQIAKLRQATHGVSNRPVQPSSGRVIVKRGF